MVGPAPRTAPRRHRLGRPRRLFRGSKLGIARILHQRPEPAPPVAHPAGVADRDRLPVRVQRPTSRQCGIGPRAPRSTQGSGGELGGDLDASGENPAQNRWRPALRDWARSESSEAGLRMVDGPRLAQVWYGTSGTSTASESAEPSTSVPYGQDRSVGSTRLPATTTPPSASHGVTDGSTRNASTCRPPGRSTDSAHRRRSTLTATHPRTRVDPSVGPRPTRRHLQHERHLVAWPERALDDHRARRHWPAAVAVDGLGARRPLRDSQRQRPR